MCIDGNEMPFLRFNNSMCLLLKNNYPNALIYLFLKIGFFISILVFSFALDEIDFGSDFLSEVLALEIMFLLFKLFIIKLNWFYYQM